MLEEATSLVLEYVKWIGRRLEYVEAVAIVTRRLLHFLEEQVAPVRQAIVRIDHRRDRFDERLQRIDSGLMSSRLE
jgi:hypothetical protein